MAKAKTVYVCSQCGYESGKWNGRCPSCGEWNTFEESTPIVSSRTSAKRAVSVRDVSDGIFEINDIDAEANETRWSTGLKELDRVLGGGGHKGAAGATVDGTLDEAKAAILAAYTEVMG